MYIDKLVNSTFETNLEKREEMDLGRNCYSSTEINHKITAIYISNFIFKLGLSNLGTTNSMPILVHHCHLRFMTHMHDD